MKFHRITSLRRIALPLLKFFNCDIFINHPWTGDRFKLSVYEHKGYWFHGKNREYDEMIVRLFVVSGANVLEVGGHIGFTTLFSRLVGSSGRVVVFEPGLTILNT